MHNTSDYCHSDPSEEMIVGYIKLILCGVIFITGGGNSALLILFCGNLGVFVKCTGALMNGCYSLVLQDQHII